MKSPIFEYFRPHTLEETVGLLAKYGEDAKILAGGQSLLPIMNMRLAEPRVLIDIRAVDALRRSTDNRDYVCYGATTSHTMIEDGLVEDPTGGTLQQAASGIGYRAIRNQGTIGGSLAHSDSSAEWPTAMSALGASVHVTGPRDSRSVPVQHLLAGFFTTTLESDELICSIRIPRPQADRWTGMYKWTRKAGEFAESLSFVSFDVANGNYANPSVWLGGARDVPVQLELVEDAIRDARIGSVGTARVRAAVAEELYGSGDAQSAGEAHQLQLHAVSVCRALRQARRVNEDE